MLINLLPDFLGVLASADRLAAYRRYFETHRPILAAYWDNYVVDPDGPFFDEVARAVVDADREDLHALLDDGGCGGGGRRRARARQRRWSTRMSRPTSS